MAFDQLATQLAGITLEYQQMQDVVEFSETAGENVLPEDMDTKIDCSVKPTSPLVYELPPEINDSSTIEEVAAFLLDFAYAEINFSLPFQNQPEKMFALCTLISDQIMERCAAESTGLPLFAPKTHLFYPFWLPDHPVNVRHLRCALWAVEEVKMRMAAKGGFGKFLEENIKD
ncbi:uncharacterized protein N0V89_008180 [Didymosphaeria variabile]|uniref:Uncharacterized protein n=1 Tax=Didymosphaeria variabile TaxID=1932322 RepID=A0A9W9C8B9_9PLEO|nr:uncharacterized protein N0V89_008180 [Didymosphaeria variabile]KAJ4349564.1 hypothetical protein N0V89_008180 [Didymosphaeria variabile]